MARRPAPAQVDQRDMQESVALSLEGTAVMPSRKASVTEVLEECAEVAHTQLDRAQASKGSASTAIVNCNGVTGRCTDGALRRT
jgi:hypothetical protein